MCGKAVHYDWQGLMQRNGTCMFARPLMCIDEEETDMIPGSFLQYILSVLPHVNLARLH